MNLESRRTTNHPPPSIVKTESTDDRKPSSPSPLSKKIVIKSADMFTDMQKEAIDAAIAAFEKHSVEKDIAEQIKKEFDKNHGPTWHCIVGRNFANSQQFGVGGSESGFDDKINEHSVLGFIVHVMESANKENRQHQAIESRA
ncbi:dynein light chain 1 [Cucumis melo var. makuwa]|uniref:Dynein light chain n=1 Tax=Cucumis melo var. makuwa TaxID=1194695 RepID=A0A5D3CY39_CUCMM|nr:dynein light chain 1 [Cucumis melo var. makuwa]TYK16188.1 dynein light chain 1 [Cucumis melo var. makuwa]